MIEQIMMKKILILFLSSLLITACKKETSEIAGVYNGTERFVETYGSVGDTMIDTTYSISMSVEYSGANLIFKKSTYPKSFTLEAKQVQKSKGFSYTKWGNPVEKWTGSFKEYKLSATFENNNWYAGGNKHYYFEGFK
ncbi:MAG: hypothetical protein H6582_12365 [Crocinitomicaceae bacterium]|nr:hypothetical protein [Crocinitomicaceae bacterium]